MIYQQTAMNPALRLLWVGVNGVSCCDGPLQSLCTLYTCVDLFIFFRYRHQFNEKAVDLLDRNESCVC